LKYFHDPQKLMKIFKLFFKVDPPFKEKMGEVFNISFNEFKKYFDGIV